MNMEMLFEDFKRYVDSMDARDIEKSISDAVAHTSNSYILDGAPTSHQDTYAQSSTHIVTASSGAKDSFSYDSLNTGVSRSYILSEGEAVAA